VKKDAWYRLDVNDVLRRLETRYGGLSSLQARENLEIYGPNRLAESKGVSKLSVLIDQFRNPLIYILLVAGLVTLVLQHYIDTTVIMAVVVLNAAIGFIQEYRAEEAMEKLARMVAAKAVVVRNGEEFEIDAGELVPGDVVVLTSGVRIPADVRLFMVKQLKVDESTLTGESLPVRKQAAAIDGGNLIPGDQLNMVFMGTIVTSGRGRGVVVETGTRTEFGKISVEMKKTEGLKTPLVLKMEAFSKRIGVAILLLGGLMMLVGMAAGYDIIDMFFTAIAMAVSAIPEGLPAVVTITLSIGVNRMAKRNAIIRKLHAVETLGSATVICSDKTGTLTKNEMTVRKVYTVGKFYDVTGTGYDPEGEFTIDGEVGKGADPSLDMTLLIGMLCNESGMYSVAGRWFVKGDPTEGALLVSAFKRGLDHEKAGVEYETLDMVPFESETGYMATLHEHDGKKLMFVKGGPEKIVGMTGSRCYADGRVQKCNREQLLDVATSLASEGLRVLAMAYREMPAGTEDISYEDVERGGLVFAGFQAMLDPPRPEAVKAIRKSKEAGIRVIMLTGDHSLTARAIAEKMGIVDAGADVITGSELEDMSDGELFRRIRDVSVFSRVSPLHKLRIVQTLQRQGEVVAVTGDGVNDATALKAAQIGVAMGVTGTDVTKEASDMVLTDDNFASIYSAVREGRIVFDNIRKVTVFLLATGVGEVMAIMAAFMLGFPLLFLPAQILWLNLVTNGLQDVALAFEREEGEVENRPPRKQDEGILAGNIFRLALTGIVIMVCVLCVFNWQVDSGATLGQARTAALTTMVFIQFFYAFMSKSENRTVFSVNIFSNKYLFASIAAAFIFQMLAIYEPTFQFFLRTEAIPAETLLVCFLAACSILVVEVEKRLRGKIWFKKIGFAERLFKLRARS